MIHADDDPATSGSALSESQHEAAVEVERVANAHAEHKGALAYFYRLGLDLNGKIVGTVLAVHRYPTFVRTDDENKP